MIKLKVNKPITNSKTPLQKQDNQSEDRGGSKMETEQEAHEAKLTGFQTTPKDGMNMSLNGMPDAGVDVILQKKAESIPPSKKLVSRI